MPKSQTARVLCIEHDPVVLQNLHDDLANHYHVDSVDNDQQALDLIRQNGFYEAVLTDLPQNTALLEEIRNLSPASVRILLAQENDIGVARHAAESGQIFQYIVHPFTAEELLSTIDLAVIENARALDKLQLEQEAKEFLSTSERLRSAMMFDPDLGVGSPEAMEIELEYMHNIAVRYKRPYSIAIFDLDQYVAYTANYGQRAARLAHKLMAEHIRHSCRAADRIYRCGAATPILLILPETGTKGAQVLAERIVQTFIARNIPHAKSEHELLSLSASLAGYDQDRSDKPESWQSLLDEAMLYLQVSQSQGGNCIAFSSGETEGIAQ
ncbi:MAG: diguanylate cyclase [Gammaproteobacteria bacterium]|nr:diguanylate cyclase [Gammaproteobacteria bacterium]